MNLLDGDIPGRAVRAAVAAAARHGVHAADPQVLEDGYNVIVWLRPAPVVARVVTLSSLLRPGAEMIRRELAVADFVAAQGVPAVRPSTALPPGPHRQDGLWMSFWDHLPVVEGVPTAATAGSMLRELHVALAGYPDTGAGFDVPLRDIEMFLRTARHYPALDEDQVKNLTRHYEAMCAVDWESLDGAPQQLHGDAHVHNIAYTTEGWRWIDFEETLRGPRAWDVATMRTVHEVGDKVVTAYGAVDERALALCTRLRGLYHVPWCAVMAQVRPEYGDKARRLLAELQRH